MSAPLGQWTVAARLTAATAEIVSPGRLSKHAAQISKPDTAGDIVLSRRIPVPGAGWYRLEADLKSVMVRPYSMFALSVTPFAKDKRCGPTQAFKYDDGIVKDNAFGGAAKPPQTLGDWRTTRHAFELKAPADSIELEISLSGGQAILRVDNVRLEFVGREKPSFGPPRVYTCKLGGSPLQRDLDMLTPGSKYRLQVEVMANGREHPSLAATARDFDGKVVPCALVALKSDAARVFTYDFTMPNDAVVLNLRLADGNRTSPTGTAVDEPWGQLDVFMLPQDFPQPDAAYQKYVSSGKPAELRPAKYRDLSDYDLDALKAHLAQRRPVDAEVVKHNGGLCFRIGGHLSPPVMATSLYGTSHYSQYDRLVAEGVNVVVCPYPFRGVAMHGDWAGPGQYDFHDLDNEVYGVLAPIPDAYVIVSVSESVPPAWWALRHPDQLVQDQEGRAQYSVGRGLYSRRYVEPKEMSAFLDKQVKADHYYKRRGAKWPGFFMPSPASTKYHADMRDFLAALRRHIEAQPYGVAVIGYWLGWGVDGQWHMANDVGATAEGSHFTDYSPAMLARFRQYLRARYRTDEALRRAWDDPRVTMETAALPPPAMHKVSRSRQDDYLLDPAADRMLIDYRECESLCIGETLNALGKAIKEAGPRKVLTVAYYPDISGNCTGNAGHQSGHDVVLSSPYLDIAGNPGYEARDIGQGGMTGLSHDSYALHGKLSMTECDHRVFTVVHRQYCNNILFDTPRKTASVLQREFARAICNGGGWWTYDMGLGWFDDPIIARIVGQGRRVFTKCLDVDRSSVAKFGVFFGEYGKMVQADERNGMIPLTLVGRLRAMLPQMGVPHEVYRMTDLSAVAHRFKVFYFPFAYALEDDEAAAINALKRDGNLLIFGYGAGYVRSGRKSIDGVSEMIGMNVSETPNLVLMIEFNPDTHPITRGLKGFIGTGIEQGLPRIFVADPKAIALGTIGPKRDKIGLAFKDCGNWQSVYIGCVGLIPPELLRNIARFKGLHVYGDGGDPMYFCHDLVAIHAATEGEKRITLPEVCSVTELWSGKSLGKVSVIARPMRIGDNALYLLEKP